MSEQVQSMEYAAAKAMKISSFADIPVLVDPDKLYDFLCGISLEEGGLFARCMAIGIENGFDKLEDDEFMIGRARLSPWKWRRKRRWIKRTIKETYGTIWSVQDAGRA